MKRNHLLLLAAVAAVVIALLLVGREPAPTSAGLDEGALYPGLEASVNEIERVVIQGPGDLGVTLTRDGERWLVEPPGGYPADVARLRELLLGVAQARLIEAKTSKPELYERLGLQGLDEDNSPTRRLQLGRSGELTQDLWVGDRRQGESFVRREGEAQTWLVSGRIEASADPVDWLQKTIMDIPIERIRSVDVRPQNAQDFRLERDSAETDFAMPGQPESTRLKQASVERLAGALNDLSLRDVTRVQEEDAGSGRSLRFETFDGLAVEARLAKREDRYFLRLQIGHAEPSADLDDAARAAAEAAGRSLSAAVEPWEFELSEYDGGSFGLLRADLLENQGTE